ncbi:MAG: hypothetical protein PBU97_22030 [Stenotrophomonas maltophilia]
MGARDLTFGAAAALVGSAGLGQLLAWHFTRPAVAQGLSRHMPRAQGAPRR